MFGVVGASLGGGFIGHEVTLSGGTTAVLSGITTNTDLSIFAIASAGAIRLSESSLSKSVMLSEAVLTNAAFTELGVIRGGGISAAGRNSGCDNQRHCNRAMDQSNLWSTRLMR